MAIKDKISQLQQHTRRVKITKHSLPIFAFLITSLIIVWPLLNQNKDKFTLAVPSTGESSHQIEMENLRFFGINDKNFPMTLQTPKVQKDPKRPEWAKMQKPIATYQMEQGDILTMTTPYALIDQQKQIVFFEDRLSGKTDAGYQFKTSQVMCDYTKGTADTNSPVSVSGPAGQINAQGLTLSNRGDLILFKKKATAVVKNKNENIHISALNGIQIDQKKKTIVAEKSAQIRQKDITVKADKLILFYTDNKKDRIQKIEAYNNVQMDNTKQIMTGNFGIYTPATKQGKMTGNVVIKQDGHYMKGDTATLDLVTGKNNLTAKQRITGQLIPNQIKENTNEHK